MTTRIVIAAQDQALGQELQGTVLEMDDAEVVSIVTGSDELREALLKADADVAIVDDTIGPEPALSVLRDMSVRRPATALLLATRVVDAEVVTDAMEAGARGIVVLPATYGQMEGRLTAAAAWSTQMRRVLAQSGAGGGFDDDTGRGRLVGVAGAKGGVGATTVVTHLAFDLARTVSSVSVCLVDLDLEKGDVPGHVEVRHRLGVADLAKVADDLSPGTVADAMTQHESGVDILLAPVDIREVEVVTSTALRQIVAALRRQYDLVLVDLGSHVTPAQATVLELVDEVVLVVTPDVAAMRGMRRTINAWESLGVCKEADVRVLLNRASKQVTVSLETVRQLTKATVLPDGLPAGFRRLEPALNSRDPLAVRSPAWWNGLRALGKELALVPGQDVRRRPAAVPDPPQEPARTGRRRARERGQLTLETVGVLPMLGMVLVLAWHLTMLGTMGVVQSYAASVAARSVGIGEDPDRAVDEALPWFFADDVTVTGTGTGVRVTVGIPGTIPGFPGIPDQISTTRSVVHEPGSRR